jgi:hypothetical protein
MTRLSILITILGVGMLSFGLLLGIAPGAAAPLPQEATPIPNLSISDEYCLSCHGQPGQTFPLEDGTSLDLYVDPLDHANSIHGSLGYACVQCHADVGEYPHPPFSATDQRDATLQLNVVCSRCHLSQYEDALDSVHGAALQAGNRNAAVCTDCHTAHAVQDWVNDETGETLPEARILIPQTCAQCHNEIYQTYVTSVHGEALTEENNPDVPTCIDCHGVHNIEDPTTTEFRLASPQLCADCHTDPERMAKYGISTDVLDTYVADFHGTTVTIFEKQSPDQETNKPVCYDCHGVHDIRRADDPEKGLQVKENMLAACQRCHPDASENFPTAWLSHYIPSPEKYPLVYYVDLFYKFFIPTVLGGMGILVVLDASRMVINRRKKILEEDEGELEAAEVTPEAAPEEPLEEAAPETKTAAPKLETTSEAPVEDEPQAPFESEEEDIEPASSSLDSPPEDEEPPPAQNHTDTTPPGEESNND